MIALQVFFITRRTRSSKRQAIPDASRAADVLKTLKKTSGKGAPKPQVIEAVDSNLFKKFESNLKKKDSAKEPALPEEEQDVIVSISSKKSAKKPVKASLSKQEDEKKEAVATPLKQKTVSPATKPKPDENPETIKKLKETIKVEPIDGLFDDVQENLEEEAISAEPERPLVSNEFLTGSDLSSNSGDDAEEIELVYGAANKEYSIGNYEESLAAIRQFLQSEKKVSGTTEQLVRLLELKAECEYELEQYSRSAKTLQEIVPQHITRNSPDFLPLLEKFIAKFKANDQEKHAIQFLFTALNEYRQLHDHAKMDETYDDIETAYRQLEDWPRLIQSYQNHLTIKKALKDYQGQLDLLDQLGKLLYDQGEEDKSRKCYKQRLVIENEMAKAMK